MLATTDAAAAAVQSFANVAPPIPRATSSAGGRFWESPFTGTPCGPIMLARIRGGDA